MTRTWASTGLKKPVIGQWPSEGKLPQGVELLLPDLLHACGYQSNALRFGGRR